jgi:hypothetical protein
MLTERFLQFEGAAASWSARIDRVDGLLDTFADLELRYISAGYDDDRVLPTAAEVLRQVVTEVAILRREASSNRLPSADVVARPAADIAAAEAGAQDNLRAGLEAMAADLIFAETAAARRTLRQQLRELRTAGAGAVIDARTLGLRQAWPGAAIVALLLAWGFIRSSRVQAPSNPVAPEAAAQSIATDHASADVLRPQTSVVNLQAAGELCTAIGRLDAAADLPALLARAGSVLHAPKVVLWMAAGDALFPVAGHGYGLEQLNRLGPLGRTASNATAASWRTETLQIVAGDATSQSAVVAPLLGTDRCVGVLAIEVDAGRETAVDTQAVTTMIAAQLAAVLSAWPAASAPPSAEVVPFDRSARAT